MSSVSLIIPPFSVQVDDCTVEVLEVKKHELISGEKFYSVAVRFNYKGIKSKIVNLTVKDEKDLQRKLKIEVSKIKFLEMTYGINYVKGVLT
ncbi:MAG: hypothetical protein NDF55_10755 [archaeon GB-1867-005]|nr:hypothetical protein [Candidatus Culexmicrobium cathedralense]